MNLADVNGGEQIAHVVLEVQQVHESVVIKREGLDDVISDVLNALELQEGRESLISLGKR
jgi:hypothetical protein